jgi:hypothetical protein
MITFPTLFQSPIQVYDHIFLTIGNGYTWKDGELVYDAENTLCNSTEEAVDRLFNDFVDDIETVSHPGTDEVFRAKFINRKVTNNKKYIHNILHVEENLDVLTIPESNSFEFYSLSKYSSLANIPDDIRYDWLVAIKDFVDILDNNRDKFKDCDTLFDGIRERVNLLFTKKTQEFIKQLS